MNKASFTNELGNEIQISVKSVPAVEIKISGPTSEWTNFLTRKEACELRDLLVSALTPLNSKPIVTD